MTHITQTREDTQTLGMQLAATLKRGDVVCFNTDEDTTNKNDLSDHTGIYLDKGYFIHASSSGQKVMISQFVSGSSDFYKRTFSWGRRILE